ncbi:hypothetical protein [Ralstonia sp. UBA689]|uniref:hypothetical protein n=1 Tax=Ralstonia sp. UBA689 TaxID=1947373 RepID=UPI0025FEC2E1|nr:hypothetical protein [Ralstonia sp. UBA689]
MAEFDSTNAAEHDLRIMSARGAHLVFSDKEEMMCYVRKTANALAELSAVLQAVDIRETNTAPEFVSGSIAVMNDMAWQIEQALDALWYEEEQQRKGV